MSTDEPKKHIEAESLLARQLRFEQAVTKVSKCLVSAQSSEQIVPAALASLLEASRVARVYIFKNFEDADDGLCMKHAYEVCAPGITPEIDNPNLQHVVYSQGFERWREALASGLNIRGDISDFPDDEREILEPQGILSILVLPIVVDGRWWGFVGFDETRTRRDWQDSEVALLGTTAEMLGSYFTRQQVQERLERVAAELKLAQRIAKVGNWSFDPAVGVPQWSDEVYRIYERSPDLGPIPLAEYRKLYSPEQFEVFHSAISAAIEKGTPYNIELQLTLPSGVHKWINAICEPFPKKGPEGYCLLGTIQDVTEKKKTEVALRESEQRLRAVFNDVDGVPIQGYDKDRRVIFWNPASEVLYGYSADEAIGKALEELIIPEEMRQAVIEGVQQWHDEGIPIPAGEIELLNNKGERLQVYSNHVMVVNHYGEKEMFCIDVDLTEIRRIERRMASLSAIVENSDNIAVVKDLDLRVVATNSAFAKAAGHATIDTMIGKTDAEIFGVSPETEPIRSYMLDERLAQTLPPGEYIMREEPVVQPNGEVRTVLTKKYPIYNQLGHLVGTGNISTDITERKKVEDALRESEDFLNRTGDMAKVGGWEVELESQKVIWTRTTGRIHDLPDDYFPDLEEAIGYYHPDDQELVRHCVQCAIENGEPFDFTVRLITAKGQERWVRALGQPIFDSGHCIRLSGTFQDITESKRMEEERERLSNQLQQAQKMEAVGRLAGGVAHDFNNMLGIIIGHADMLLDEIEPDQPFYDDLIDIREAGKRSANLTRQLLAFARKQTVAPIVLDLNKTVSDMLKMLQRLIGEDIEMVWLPEERVWPTKIDPGQVDQILANLCVNARDAITDVGRVTIETGNIVFDEDYCDEHAEFTPGEYVMLAVSDDGCGMSSEAQEHIFEPFYTTKEFGKGTGLGLATVYGAVKQNNGFINVYSEQDQGTAFKIYLPRHKAKAISEPQKADRSVEHGHETILLVEDEPMILKITIKILKRDGYTVLGARTPGEAIRLAREHTGDIHLLMTDVVMPEMNGRELAKNVLSIYPSAKCLFMSGYTANVIAHHGVLDEGVNFIQKPFSRADLAAKVRDVLEQK